MLIDWRAIRRSHHVDLLMAPLPTDILTINDVV